MDSRPPRCMPCASAVGLDVFRGSSRLVRMALAVAMAKEVGEWGSTSTCVLHAASVCGWMGYLNVGTLGAMAADVIDWSGGIRIGIEVRLRTSQWSRNDVGIVYVGPSWAVRPLGSHIARWSMQVACSGFEGGGVNVGVIGPSHLRKGRLHILSSLAFRPLQLPWKSPPGIRTWYGSSLGRAESAMHVRVWTSASCGR